MEAGTISPGSGSPRALSRSPGRDVAEAYQPLHSPRTAQAREAQAGKRGSMRGRRASTEMMFGRHSLNLSPAAGAATGLNLNLTSANQADKPVTGWSLVAVWKRSLHTVRLHTLVGMQVHASHAASQCKLVPWLEKVLAAHMLAA